jgi:hypothetical protein
MGLAALLIAGGAQAQDVPPEDDLHAQIAAMDTALFAASRNCDEPTMNSIFREDLEFYHDVTGLTEPRERVMVDIMRFCDDDGVGLRRALVEGSLEVHPLPGFGAIQIADHVFFELIDGEEKPVGSARLVHIWQKADGEWKLARVLSYDHAPAAAP